MSNERICPECGAKLKENENFCHECGADFPVEPAGKKEESAPAAESVPPAAAMPSIGKEQGKVQDSMPEVPASGNKTSVVGDKANIMGGVSDNSVRQTTVNTNRQTSINTSSVDNSSTVNNNTTIVMGKDNVEYCEVCGNPFGEKHARCPKCGKQICFDCKVPGKNRCIECEKKALNEYRLSFQQLFLTTGGDIGISGRQMMDQKARDLDVEKEKEGIEEEVAKAFRPAVRPVQPQPVQQSHPSHPQPVQQSVKPVQEPHQPVKPSQPVSGNPSRPQQPQQSQPQKPARTVGNFSEADMKGIGSLTGDAPITPSKPRGTGNSDNSGGKEKGGKGKGLLWVVIIIAIAAAAYFIFAGKGDKEPVKEQPVKTESVSGQPSRPQQPETPAAQSDRNDEAPSASKPAPASAPAATVQQDRPKAAASKPAPVEKKTDANYDKGMEAYKSGNGLDAVKYFKASGSADSYYMLGIIYEGGCGSVAANSMMARQNFKKAAEMGSKEAEARL